MQLVAMGAQDVFITGNPQMSFFKNIYKRHTNFSKECIKQELKGGSFPLTNGKNTDVTCNLSRNGDLVQEIYLKASVSSVKDNIISPAGSTQNFIISYANHPQHGPIAELGLMNSSSLNVGDQIIFDDDIFITNSANETNKARLPPDENDPEAGVLLRKLIEANKKYTVKFCIGDSRIKHIKLEDVIFIPLPTANADYPKLSLSNSSEVEVKTNIRSDKDILEEVDLTSLINTVELEIGGQQIDKHYSTWLTIYNELFEIKHNYRLAMSNASRKAPFGLNKNDVYIPLRFWFNRNPGLALPLIALQYHEVEIKMNISNNFSGLSVDTSSLLVNYIYLDTDERRRFAQVSHEYLIEQIQHTGNETITTGKTIVDLTFNHPVKALYWRGLSLGNYNAKLQFNGHDRFSEQDESYFHAVQMYECKIGHSKALDNATNKWGPNHLGLTTSTGMYSFCLNPGNHQPSGSCNFSRIDNARLVFSDSTVSGNLGIFAVNYNVLRIMSGMGGLTYSN